MERLETKPGITESEAETQTEENMLSGKTGQETPVTEVAAAENTQPDTAASDRTLDISSQMKPAPRFGKQYVQDTVRLVVFKLAGHEHALDVYGVREIMIAPPVSPVLEAPDFVEGVIKLRGKIVPVLDLRKRLQLPVPPQTYESCIIIVMFKKKPIGLLVDSASELLKVPTKSIEAPDRMIGGVRTRFMDGVIYLEHRFLVILNLEAILDLEEEELWELSSVKNEEISGQDPVLGGTINSHSLNAEEMDNHEG